MSICPCLDYSDGTPGIAELGLGVAAWRYIERGYEVLPLARGGKKPHRMLPWDPGSPSGVHHATGNWMTAGNWWATDKAANIGVATGRRSQLAVIDLDVKNGRDGPGVFAQFLAQHNLPMPASAWVCTPSGGIHIWLRTQPGETVPERPGILPGVDVKGDGGLVAAAPSMQLRHPLARPGEHGGDPAPVPYEWVGGCPCAAPGAPGWLLPWLSSAPAAGAAGAGAGIPDGGDLGLEDLARTGIPAGQRNRDLYRLACRRLRVHGTTPDGCAAVAAELRQVLGASDRSGFSDGELATILRSARQFIERAQQAEHAAASAAVAWLERK